MKRSEKPKEEEGESELPKVEVFSPSEGKPSTGDLVASESRVEYRSPGMRTCSGAGLEDEVVGT